MIRIQLTALVMLMIFLANAATAFETQTHALITRQAYERSALAKTGDGSIIRRLGLDRLDAWTPFDAYWKPERPSAYYTEVWSEIEPLPDQPADFERCQMQQFLFLLGDQRKSFVTLFSDTVEFDGRPLLPISNWLVRGAIREDDLGGGLIGRWPTVDAACGALWRDTIPNQPPIGFLGLRSLNHFYDPEFDIGLRTTMFLLPINGIKSVDWALGYEDSFSPSPIREFINTYSYDDARNAFWKALTRRKNKAVGLPDTSRARAEEAEDRMILWATLFRSLGNVVHLLEDTAQPQHTRNDPHSGKNTDQQQAFEGYTNARILGGNEVGSFVRGFFASVPGDLPVPPLGTYGVGNPIMFATPLRFFTTRIGLDGVGTEFYSRTGLADYSNRGFFTGGTLPGVQNDYPHRSPPPDFLDPANGYSTSNSTCESAFVVDPRLRSATCLFYLRAVADNTDPVYAATMDRLPNGFTLPNVPVATDGIFRLALPPVPGAPEELLLSGITWSPAVLEAIGNLAIPRAIGYAAGFLDFFFRGQIELSSPPDGLYAVADQGVAHSVTDGLPIASDGRAFGFKKIRVRIRNTTMVDAEGNHTLRDAGTRTIVPQTMRGGTNSSGQQTGKLVAIARYHRNPCYEPDLSGEYVTMPDPITGMPNASDRRVPNGCARADTRTNIPEISVSTPLQLDQAGNLPGVPAGGTNACLNVGNINTGAPGSECENDAVLAEFDFGADPIPINATDLFLQVAYRGPLGLEEDGIAVGMIDVLEPNYLSMWNNTDWFYLNGEWVAPETVPTLPSPNQSEAVPIDDMFMCFGTQAIATLMPGQTLQPRQFVRVAVIADINPMPVGTYAVVGHYGNYQPGQATGLVRQMFFEDSALTPYPYQPLPMPRYVRGTPMGSSAIGPFFHYGVETVDNSMRAMVLQPPIGIPAAGIATPIRADLEVIPEACKPLPDDPTQP